MAAMLYFFQDGGALAAVAPGRVMLHRPHREPVQLLTDFQDRYPCPGHAEPPLSRSLMCNLAHRLK